MSISRVKQSHRFLLLFVVISAVLLFLNSNQSILLFTPSTDKVDSVQTKDRRLDRAHMDSPAGWQYHTPSELRQLYRGKDILWIGDSTGRRTAMTLYALLDWSSNSTFLLSDLSDPALIDATKYSEPECTKWPDAHDRPTICRPVEGGGSVSFVPLSCHHDVERFFQHNDTVLITQDVDLIVVAVGIWEVLRRSVCGEANRTLAEVAAAAIQSAHEFQRATQKRILWRTSGYSHHGPILSNAVTELNEMVMDMFDQMMTTSTGFENTRLSYVNWGGAVQPRSRLGERIEGDVKAHYGLEPRLVLIEMMTNHLVEVGFCG